jgi:hypothetical protein
MREIGTAIGQGKNDIYVCAVLGAPDNYGEDEDENEEYNENEIGNLVIQTAKKYGKLAAKNLLIKVAKSTKSNEMKNFMNSPLMQKIIASLR